MNERLAIEWRDLRYLNEISFAMLKQTKLTVFKVLWVCKRIKGVKSANKGSQAQELCHSLVFAHVKHVCHSCHTCHRNTSSESFLIIHIRVGSCIYKFNRSVVWLNANAKVNESNLVECKGKSERLG